MTFLKTIIIAITVVFAASIFASFNRYSLTATVPTQTMMAPIIYKLDKLTGSVTSIDAGGEHRIQINH